MRERQRDSELSGWRPGQRERGRPVRGRVSLNPSVALKGMRRAENVGRFAKGGVPREKSGGKLEVASERWHPGRSEASETRRAGSSRCAGTWTKS